MSNKIQPLSVKEIDATRGAITGLLDELRERMEASEHSVSAPLRVAAGSLSQAARLLGEAVQAQLKLDAPAAPAADAPAEAPAPTETTA